MARAYKWVGGIGYVLTFIPYVNFVAAILVAVAWIMMGKDVDQRLFTVTGILMILVFIFSIAFAGAIFAMAPGILAGPMMEGAPPLGLLKNILAHLKIVVALVLAMAALAIATVIAEIASHFRASRIFQSTWFKVGGWLRVGGVIGLIIAIPVAFWRVFQMRGILAGMMPRTATEAVFGILIGMFWPLILVAILGILATIFSAIAFFTIPEEVVRG